MRTLSSMISRLRWSVAPADMPPEQKANFVTVQTDALGVALAAGAGPFLAVFLTRLGASNFQVGLLTAMPAFTGLLFSIAAGQFLQRRRNIVPWYAALRLIYISANTLTGIVPFVVPRPYIVPVVLAIWMAVTLPQTMLGISFTVVMSSVAGPKYRYDLMSRRWSIIGLIKAILVAIAGQVLELFGFPLNYQVVFIVLSLGGLLSFYASNRIRLPDVEPQPRPAGRSLRQQVGEYLERVRGERDFMAFVSKRFVFTLGATLAVPLLPIYYVRQVEASDAWIGIISSAETAIMLLGYFFWARQSKVRGSRFVLLCTTFAVALHPALVASSRQVGLIALFAALAGVFQAGLNLVFFDELMKTVPAEYSATFVSFSASLVHLSNVIAPLLGTTLADRFGVGTALFVSAGLRLAGFALFAWRRKHHT